MSINSSLIKLANKIDTDGVSEVTPDYKNPNNSIEKSLERIADNYENSGGGGGTGGGVLVVNIDMQTMTLDKTWQEIYDAPLAVINVNQVFDDLNSGSKFLVLMTEANPTLGVYNLFVAVPNVENNEITFAKVRFDADGPDAYPVAQMG